MLFVPTNEVVDEAVKAYAQSIIDAAKEIDPNIEIELDFDEELHINQTEKASSAMLESKFGLIKVFPDFRKQTAKAAIINRGLIQTMLLEGYTEEEVDESGIYGHLYPPTKTYIEVFATFLTTDLGIQAQKNLNT